jgi:malate dehydrogenase (oxaloacetate-decarboxylating)
LKLKKDRVQKLGGESMIDSKINVDELMAKANKPVKEAPPLHAYYRGKMQTVPRCAIRDLNDFAIWYTPGVAEPCRQIKADPSKVYEFTSKWNTIAVVTDGTRVLGLGDIGPEAGLPVMEGKSLLFKYLGGVDAVPICLDTKDPDEIIRTVKLIQPSFGGINLEDFSSPKCYRILDTLRKEMSIPVFHDDEQGTALVTLAGLVNALKVVGKRKEDVKIAFIGVGAANSAVTKLLFRDGFKPENSIVLDVNGILNPDRTDIEQIQAQDPYLWKLCLTTNPEHRKGGIGEAMRGMDAVVAYSRPVPGTIKPEWVKSMAKDAIVFACANPNPEIWPWDAKEAGAKVIATGRSDFPNQVNNSTGFPAIFRGTLDVRAKTITDEMCLAAAYELAKCAEEKGLIAEYITPLIDDSDALVREAVAVGMKAIELGIAQVPLSRTALTRQVKKMINSAKKAEAALMKNGVIPEWPEDYKE